MRDRKATTIVRKNVTIDKYTADKLENLSEVTGRSQGILLEIALNQPIMQRLFAFAYNEETNPIIQLLETYQTYEGHMDSRVGESILQAVKKWFKDCANVKLGLNLAEVAPYLNSYIRGHITEGSKNADSYFKDVYEQANTNQFITSDMRANELKGRILDYIDAMLNGVLDKNIISESYLFRNLLVILSECFEPPTENEIMDLFNILSDGRVLPYFSPLV